MIVFGTSKLLIDYLENMDTRKIVKSALLKN